MRAFSLFLSLLFPVCASATNVILNGGFESGLANWNTAIVSTSVSSIANTNLSPCGTSWYLASTGSTCSSVANAVGTGAAYSAFDGYGASNSLPSYAAVLYDLYQEFVVPNGIETAQLSWLDSVATNYSGRSRTFTVAILDLSDNSSYTANLRDFGGLSNVNENTFTARNVDVTSLLQPLAGRNVQLKFQLYIPQYFTGPAGIGLDDVALNIQTAEVAEPSTFGLVLVAGVVLLKRSRSRSGGVDTRDAVGR
jgi:hypothetical protein